VAWVALAPLLTVRARSVSSTAVIEGTCCTGLTAEGRRQLDAEMDEWNRTSAAVNRVLRYAYLGA
jgi:hypothetical protein